MAKNVNIHVKTTGAAESKRKVDGVASSTEKMGSKTSRAAGVMKGALGTMAGALGFAGLAASAIGSIRKIIAAIDDMKKAVNEAVKTLAAQQTAAADFFEAFDAYTPKERKKALTMARQFQEKTGLPFDSSKSLLEIYKRSYGDVSPESTEQLAGYWQLHGGDATADLVRWISANGVQGADRQGQITRLISTTATQTGMRDGEIIRGLLQYSTEFRQMGWTPEQTIMNVGKSAKGLSSREARKAIGGLVEGLKTFSEEKAVEMGAPASVAADEQARIAWAEERVRSLQGPDRKKFAQEAFGKTYSAYVTKYMAGEMSPAAQAALDYSLTPEAAQEERQRVLAFRGTAEGVLNRAEGTAGRFDIAVNEDEKYWAAIREIGASFLTKLRYKDRVKYEALNLLSDEMGKEAAAEELYLTQYPNTEQSGWVRGPKNERAWVPKSHPGWDELSPQQKLEQLQPAAQSVIIQYNINMNYNPRVDPDQSKTRLLEKY